MFIFAVLIKKLRVAECPTIKAALRHAFLRATLGNFYYSMFLHISQIWGRAPPGFVEVSTDVPRSAAALVGSSEIYNFCGIELHGSKWFCGVGFFSGIRAIDGVSNNF
ncbi:unnamed protein product [Macrosiphum euphorbiae]|uniref:Uncharacterized protein n=1 Tax=Macrosiphum euphorbiae TaxID=13131 RepID=A0AAV0WKM3_9HEMI|nr:unnamed protein product [Macrosiphum euphorbiae]